MTNVLEIARQRAAQIQREIEALDAFLDTAEALVAGAARPPERAAAPEPAATRDRTLRQPRPRLERPVEAPVEHPVEVEQWPDHDDHRASRQVEARTESRNETRAEPRAEQQPGIARVIREPLFQKILADIRASDRTRGRTAAAV